MVMLQSHAFSPQKGPYDSLKACNIYNRIAMEILKASKHITSLYNLSRVPHPIWKTLKTGNFVIYFSRPGKARNLLKQWEKPGILTQILEQI